MGFFHKQQGQTDDEAPDTEMEQRFMDSNFNEELRNHARWYFQKIINANGAVFKRDLDTTINEIRAELKDHVTKQLDEAVTKMNLELKEHVSAKLDEQFAGVSQSIKEAQDTALQTLAKSSDELQQQYQSLSGAIKTNLESQEEQISTAFEDNKKRMSAMSDAQSTALQWLQHTAESLQAQEEQIETAIHDNIDKEKALLMRSYEENMAIVIEHYLLGALGDQYDLKAQLPAIIKQMEEQKQAITDDMRI